MFCCVACGHIKGRLRKTKVFASLSHGSVHLMSQLLISLILGKIKFCDSLLALIPSISQIWTKLTVEAGMTTRQTILAAIITMNVKLGKAIHALEFLEAIERHLGSASDELQKLGFLFLVEAAYRAPEPLDLGRGLLVVVVFGVVLPVVDVDIGQS